MNRHDQHVYELVAERDQGCIGPRVGFPLPCNGRIERDHVDNGGHGRRGPTEPSNVVQLCTRHHRWKTEHARRARELIHAYLTEFYGLGL